MRNIRGGEPRFLTSIAISLACSAIMGCGGSSGSDAAAATSDRATLGARTINVRGNRDLVENSAAVTSVMQPGVIFGINDSGNDPVLYALDTLGRDRGSWVVAGARNVDWEAMSQGPCGTGRAGATDDGSLAQTTPARVSDSCLFIGDIGDNGSERPSVTLYRVPEPWATTGSQPGVLRPERVHMSYPEAKPDVEAMYVAANGDTFLITKRRMVGADGSVRPALVYRLDASAWETSDTVLVELIDSLPIYPGSARGRQVTDAALSHDRRRLAVRTYAEVFVFDVDSISGRLARGARWWSCPVDQLEEKQGEGVAWLGSSILLTSEGRDAPMHVIRCVPPPP